MTKKKTKASKPSLTREQLERELVLTIEMRNQLLEVLHYSREFEKTMQELRQLEPIARSSLGGQQAHANFERERIEDQKIWLKEAQEKWRANPHKSCEELSRQMAQRELGSKRVIADFLRDWKRRNPDFFPEWKRKNAER